jgi:hypothetical protein
MNAKAKKATQVAVVRDVEFHYPHLATAHAPFGSDIWDVQLRTNDQDTAKRLTDLGVGIKKHDKEGYFFGNVKRPTTNKAGDVNKAPEVLDAAKSKTAIDPRTIGHGSKGHVKVFSYEYDFNGKQGTGVQLLAIQITDLVKYEPKSGGDDFGVEGDAVEAEEF